MRRTLRRLDSGALSDRGLVRPTNQDALLCRPDLGVFAIADGLGGHADGDLAARTAIEEIERALLGTATRSEDLLKEAFHGAHRAIRERALETRGTATSRPVLRPRATTAVVLCLCTGARALWGHVGDSRLYRLRRGRLALLTADHTEAGQLCREGTDFPLDLAHTNHLLAALGVEDSLDPTVTLGDARHDDVWLLCSDGISEPLSPEILQQELAGEGPAQRIAERLVAAALAAGGPDNATAVIIRAAAGRTALP